ncbi:MAG TPA: hypothetical protein DIW17_10720 [Clostridiales bacterium]|nr:hypothetical protein [Clostridiales bacterium]
MLKVEFHAQAPVDIDLTYVVIAARHGGKWLFVRHKERTTYEIPGGHIETGEDYLTAAKRELFEETGAKEFSLDFVSVYTVTSDEKASGGYLFFADVKELAELPDFEMAEVALRDNLPDNLTYSQIQPHLYGKVLEWATFRRLEWGAAPESKIHSQNKCSWNAMADNWSGTVLPVWGCSCPTEDELHLMPDLNDKKVLEIGCGSGQSLKWCGDRGAAELWGLDISNRQLELAYEFLKDNGYKANLFNSPMEQNPLDDTGIELLPKHYFDIIYSVYAIGWATGLQATFDLISSYLKKDGSFIFSWDHPFMHCVDETEGRLLFSGSYHEAEPFTFQKHGNPLTLHNRRLCDYINTLSKAGFAIERIVEETDSETMNRDVEFTSGYYSSTKAKKFPLSIIIKARKL